MKRDFAYFFRESTAQDPNITPCVKYASQNQFSYFYKTSSNASQYHRETWYLIQDSPAIVHYGGYTDAGLNTVPGNCLSQQWLEDNFQYKPELEVYFTLASISVLTLIFVVIYKIIIKRLLP